MKMKLLYLVLMILNISFVLSQDNMVPNPGFETGAAAPTNTDCDYPNGNIGRQDFDSDLQSTWFVAKHSIDKGDDVPDWIDINFCSTRYNQFCDFYNIFPNQFFLPTKRFVALEAPQRGDKDKYYHGAIRAELINNQFLIPGTWYTIRYKILPLKLDDEKDFIHMRVHFSYWTNWNSNSNNNQKFEAINANFFRNEPTGGCVWESVERQFFVPSDKDKLRNIIFYVEHGRFIIDDVELFQSCPSQMIVSNKIYDGIFYGPNDFEGNSFVNSAANSIITQNNVEVQAGADVTFKAGQQIVLNPGFVAQAGSHFVAEIAPCTPMRLQNPDSNYISISNIEDETGAKEINNQLEITPNPTTGKFTIQIAEQDALLDVNYHLEIYNPLGEQVHTSAINHQPSTVDLSHKSKGIYFIKVISKENTFTQKIILQ